MARKMVLVDGNSLMHRAFHALPLLDDGAGVYTNAVFGFMSMLIKVLKEEEPDCLAVAFDLHGPTFRHEEYAKYKAGRPATPEELRGQFALLKEILHDMSIAVVSLERYEADDLLGTLSRHCEDMGVDALLVTGDRDAFQLAGPHTEILYTKRGITDTQRVTPAYLMERYGLSPDQMIDLKGLMGDASDNIPGIPGVGEKTALKLLGSYGSLERVLAEGPAGEKGKLREKLIEFAEQARFSKRMATIERSAPIELLVESCGVTGLAGGLATLEKYKLRAIAQRILQLPPAMTGATSSAAPVEDSPAPLPERAFQPIEVLHDREAIAAWVKRQNAEDGLSLALGAECSLATAHGAQARIAMGGGDLLTPGMDEEAALAALCPLLAGSGEKIVCDVKRVQKGMPKGATIGGHIDDVMLAAYALNAQEPSFALHDLLALRGISQDDATSAAARMWALRDMQRAQMDEEGVTDLYRDIELPLAHALFDMERVGFLVDDAALRALGAIYQEKIQDLTARIEAFAGEPFNVNSPKQLGDILFDKLGIPGGKKTARGYSTAADVLEAIEDRHEIVPLVLEYRKYAKLNSTYVEALLRLRGQDGRIHTSFDQVATATGRISSNEPNLQNIPVRTPEGREIRRAFVAPPGCVLVDADYSQIELRVLAHMSGDERLIDAFMMGQDIHRRTAAEVYDVSLDLVTPAMRSAAKAVNFGIVYGISEFGLAKNLGVARHEASEFIARYFETYPLVKRFMDAQVAQGKLSGYVTTLFHRRRYLPELGSANYNTRSFGERVAMNSPIQGTAADIIKVAMIRADHMLRREGLRARLILQVHDELIVEAPEEERTRVEALLREAMEGAAQLAVPLVADLSAGRNWHECKA